MPMMSDTNTDEKVRCSAWARDVGLSPIATIGSYSGYLLVETALPWPKDVGEIPALAEVAQRLLPRNIRLQALVPQRSDPAEFRVILYSNLGGSSFAAYHRYETTSAGSVEMAVDRVLGVADRDHGDPTFECTDLLVCTHGRRDVCCGSQGTELAMAVAAAGARPATNLWRTSHTGGHRFAPTFIVLPQGTAWAFADTDLVDRVLERSVPFADVAGNYRGCSGLVGSEAQALEREVLISVGWELMDRRRRAFTTGESTQDGGTVTRLEAGSECWEGVVRPGRRLPVPDCMSPLSEARKSETEWTVSDVRSVP